MIRHLLPALLLTAAAAQADPHPDASRVLSIGGAVTEIVHALGQQDRLIARDTTSSHPPSVMQLPDVGYMRALSAEGVLSTRPDLILAEEDAGPPEVVEILRDAGIPFETIPGGTDADALAARIEAVADALGVPQAAAGPVASLRADLAAAAEATQGQTPPASCSSCRCRAGASWRRGAGPRPMR